MGMSVCHRALAVNPQDADSVDIPWENLGLGDPAVALLLPPLGGKKEKPFCNFRWLYHDLKSERKKDVSCELQPQALAKTQELFLETTN